MDSLTQIVLGAAVAEVCLGKKAGNHAMLWGAIAGTIPDLDVLSQFFVDDIRANELHRGFSHSIVFILLMSPLLGYLLQRLYKNKFHTSFGDWTNLSFWCLFTHPMLDAHTTWGTQLFWPFDLRVAYKNINVVDPIYTLPFLVLVAIALFLSRKRVLRRKLVWAGIGISTCYMVYTIGIKLYVDQKIKGELAENNIEYHRYTSQPTFLNSILWYSLAETDSAYFVGYYSLLDKKEHIDFQKYSKDSELRRELGNEKDIQRLMKISQGWFLLFKNEEQISFKDLRFGQMGFEADPEQIVFAYTIKQGPNGLITKQEDPEVKDPGIVIQALFDRIRGN